MTLTKNLTIEQKIGQLCFLSYDETDVNGKMINLIDTFHIGGIVLTKEQFDTPKQIHHLTTYLQQYAGVNLPVFIGIHDRIQPLAAKGMTLPIAHEGMELKNNRLYTKQLAEMRGSELRAVGINMLIAPHVQIQADDAEVFLNQFRTKMQHATAAVEGYKKATVHPFPSIDEVLQTMVHFHTTEKSTVRLYFEKLLNHANTLYVKNSSSVSILRETFHYEGVIIADLSTEQPTITQMIDVIKNGANAFLLPKHYEQQLILLNEFVEKVKEGVLPLATVENAVDGLLEVKSSKDFGQINMFDRDAFMKRRHTRLVDDIIATT